VHDLIVPFFDRLPEPPPEPQDQTEQSWSPPRWDRPSEGTLPAVIGVSHLFARTENVALALDELRVYPNGFQLVISVLTSPRLPPELQMGGFHSISLLAARTTATGDDTTESPQPMPARPLRASLFMSGPRIGVQFANGQRAGTRTESPFDVPKDEAGIPTEPVIVGGGGGGGGGHFRWEHWVFPLPNPGALTVFAEWATAGIEETSVVINGDDVRDAASRAVVLWS
jgi:hypothetical protein